MTEGFPTIVFDELFHIGSLNAADKGTTHNRVSQEGNGLSVSLDPDAWMQIAKLGGNPIWVLRPTANNSFVDAHSLSESHWAMVMGWAQTQGLANPTEIIEVSWYDSEEDTRHAFHFDASVPGELERAQSELEDMEEQDGKLIRFSGWQTTPALNDRIGFSVSASMVKDMALTLYVEDVLFEAQGTQGVWWEDMLDVGAYSAPRGVIHHRTQASWVPTLAENNLERERVA